MELVGYRMSRREIRDVYYSIYLLRRSPGSLSCRELRKKKGYTGYTLLPADSVAKTDVLRTEAKDVGAQGGEWVWSDPLQSYEAALWAAHARKP